MLAVWLLVLFITGWVGLGTMLAAVMMVPAFAWLGADVPTMGFALLLAAFIAFMHRSNIRKMLNGSEHRFERIRFRNWGRRSPG